MPRTASSGFDFLNCICMNRTRDILYVSIQAIIFILYLFIGDKFFELGQMGQIFALIIVLLGFAISLIALLHLNRNISPFPSPRHDGVLITSGIYKYIRHPIYTGIVIIAVGFGLLDGSLFRVGLGIALWVFFYFKSEYEERLLVQKYAGYKDYQDRTGKLFPRIFR